MSTLPYRSSPNAQAAANLLDTLNQMIVQLQLIVNTFATVSQIQSGAAGVPIDPAGVIYLLTHLPTTLPASPGVLWNNGGVISIS